MLRFHDFTNCDIDFNPCAVGRDSWVLFSLNNYDHLWKLRHRKKVLNYFNSFSRNNKNLLKCLLEPFAISAKLTLYHAWYQYMAMYYIEIRSRLSRSAIALRLMKESHSTGLSMLTVVIWKNPEVRK